LSTDLQFDFTYHFLKSSFQDFGIGWIVSLISHVLSIFSSDSSNSMVFSYLSFREFHWINFHFQVDSDIQMFQVEIFHLFPD
jgi:hypothetical protein